LTNHQLTVSQHYYNHTAEVEKEQEEEEEMRRAQPSGAKPPIPSSQNHLSDVSKAFAFF
jgi:hypothetical protein